MVDHGLKSALNDELEFNRDQKKSISVKKAVWELAFGILTSGPMLFNHIVYRLLIWA